MWLSEGCSLAILIPLVAFGTGRHLAWKCRSLLGAWKQVAAVILYTRNIAVAIVCKPRLVLLQMGESHNTCLLVWAAILGMQRARPA